MQSVARFAGILLNVNVVSLVSEIGFVDQSSAINQNVRPPNTRSRAEMYAGCVACCPSWVTSSLVCAVCPIK